jgi:hypothetical protein
MQAGMPRSPLNPASPPISPDTPAGLEMAQLKSRIAQVWAERERLKNALNEGAMTIIHGLRKLEAVDRELAALDTRFKQLWDATNGKPIAKPNGKTNGKLNDGDASPPNPKEGR